MLQFRRLNKALSCASGPLKHLAHVVAFVLTFCAGGHHSAGAQDMAQLQAIHGDAPAFEGAPADSRLEVYTGPSVFGRKAAPASQSMTTESTATERPAALPSGVTVIAPTFIGANQNYSYIRFPNGGTGTATFNVTLVGSPTARDYGTVTVTVARFASPQYSIPDFLRVLGLSSLGPADNAVSLYIQSPQAGNYVGFQHVVWNSVTGFFENASVCTFKPTIDYSGLNQAVFNVHTSAISGYPGTIFLHNYASAAATYRGNVFDAANGNFLGAFSMTAPGNGTTLIDISNVETAIGFHPGPSQYHVNIQFQPPDGTAWNALASLAINDQQIQAYTNMSMVCSINP
jgi:hypothetical protein